MRVLVAHVVSVCGHHLAIFQRICIHHSPTRVGPLAPPPAGRLDNIVSRVRRVRLSS